MPPENAETVAYASQHTDDAKYGHALEFANGGRFHQVLTAHRFIHPEVFSLQTQYEILVPFHFVPGVEGDRFQERMICRADGSVARTTLRAAAELEDKPYQLHRLGIALHAYADTWSHQDFSGLQSDLNDVEEIHVVNEDKAGIVRLFKNFYRDIAAALIPQLGHAEAATLPDEPFREWRFELANQARSLHRKNWVICLQACRSMYRELRIFLKRNPRYCTEETFPWGGVRPVMARLFKHRGDLDERCSNWMEAVNDSAFGFPCREEERDLLYHDRKWFREAVEVEATPEGERYTRRPDFHRSHWKLFHDAADSHRFLVLKELLPQHGIICA
jgi:hypothetical protein